MRWDFDCRIQENDLSQLAFVLAGLAQIGFASRSVERSMKGMGTGQVGVVENMQAIIEDEIFIDSV